MAENSLPPTDAPKPAPTEADLKALQENFQNVLGLLSALPYANKDDVTSSLSIQSKYIETVRTKLDCVQADMAYKIEALLNRIVQLETWVKKLIDYVQTLAGLPKPAEKT